ncbi:hypothetical protein IOCL1545_000379200, partial [Leishmania shawi]
MRKEESWRRWMIERRQDGEGAGQGTLHRSADTLHPLFVASLPHFVLLVILDREEPSPGRRLLVPLTPPLRYPQRRGSLGGGTRVCVEGDMREAAGAGTPCALVKLLCQRRA